MTNATTENNGASIILDYVRNNAFWKEMYFIHFSTKQKVLFFLPIIFLFLPVYGTYSVLYNNSWTSFLITDVATMGSVYWFFKQKINFEQKVFARLYLTDSCKSVSELHFQKLSTLLGKQNTTENREAWKSHFKQRGSILLSIILASIFGLAHYFLKDENVALYYMAFISIIMLIMALSFVGHAFGGFNTRQALYNSAYQLVEQLAERDKK